MAITGNGEINSSQNISSKNYFLDKTINYPWYYQRLMFQKSDVFLNNPSASIGDYSIFLFIMSILWLFYNFTTLLRWPRNLVALRVSMTSRALETSHL